MQMIFYSSANKDRFDKKGRAKGIIWKWKFWNLEMAYYNAALMACLFPLAPLGNLSIDDGDGEDEKCIRAYFKLFRAYSISFSSLNAGESFGSWEKESSCLEFTSSSSGAVAAKKCTKERDAIAEFLFC